MLRDRSRFLLHARFQTPAAHQALHMARWEWIPGLRSVHLKCERKFPRAIQTRFLLKAGRKIVSGRRSPAHIRSRSFPVMTLTDKRAHKDSRIAAAAMLFFECSDMP